MGLFHLAARFYYFNLIRFCILPGRSSRSGFLPVPDQVVPFIINYPAFIGFNVVLQVLPCRDGSQVPDGSVPCQGADAASGVQIAAVQDIARSQTGNNVLACLHSVKIENISFPGNMGFHIVSRSYGIPVDDKAAQFETIGEGAGAHGLDVPALIKDINACIKANA